MGFRIARSVLNRLGYNYAEAVEDFRQAKLAHRFTGDAAPSAPAEVEHAVRRVPVEGAADDFVADYEVIEDVPVPTLADRRAVLVGQVRAMEAAALARIISPGRERLMALDLNMIHMKPEADRTAGDLTLLARAADIVARKTVIHRHAAELEIAIEDLTEVTIDGFTPAAFPELADRS
jgi:hypothetical protein